jgi:DNA-binding response OmpR family regulator
MANRGDIIKFMGDIHLNFKKFAQKQNIELLFNNSNETLEAWFDSDKLEKICFNLISNAIKFTPEGGKIKLSIKANESYYKIIVEDTGIGIPAHEIEKIFDPFYQTRLSRKSSIEGTGIGLALVKSLVELHHGTLFVRSFTKDTIPEGVEFSTYFEIKLPLGMDFLRPDEIITDDGKKENMAYLKPLIQMPDDDFDDDTLVGVDEAIESREKPIVLFIEDNEELRKFVVQSLHYQFTIELAANGREGLAKAIELIPDIVVSDVMMPEMSGIELCEAIKCDQRISHIPVILLTARSADEHYMEGYASGADDYVVKPFNMVLLAARITNLISIRLLLKKQFNRDLTSKPANMIENKVDSEFLKKVIAIIEEKMSESEFNVDALSSEIGMSSRHLLNKLQSLTDNTPVELIRILRLKRAVELLNEQKLSISEIAYDVGFSSPAYFSRCFQKLYNQSPTDYLSSLK